MNDEVTIRIEKLTTLEQFERCVELQTAVWSYDAADLIPKRMFLLAHKIGGAVFGGIDERTGEIIAFAMGLSGYRDRTPYLHSHMLAVLPAYRNLGIGRKLKLAQRDDAIERGFELMEWTFDPLEIKNAHLNIARLGAICRRYARNFYGSSSSPLQGGLPTDRLYAEWWLRSDRVERMLEAERTLPPTATEQRVFVPREIPAWKADGVLRAKALAVQTRNREELEAAFAKGLAVVGYERTPEGDGAFLLGPVPDLKPTTR